LIATARVLAHSHKALDTPLSPPPLDDEPGPATGRSDTHVDGLPPAGLDQLPGRNMVAAYTGIIFVVSCSACSGSNDDGAPSGDRARLDSGPIRTIANHKQDHRHPARPPECSTTTGRVTTYVVYVPYNPDMG